MWRETNPCWLEYRLCCAIMSSEYWPQCTMRPAIRTIYFGLANVVPEAPFQLFIFFISSRLYIFRRSTQHNLKRLCCFKNFIFRSLKSSYENFYLPSASNSLRIYRTFSKYISTHRGMCLHLPEGKSSYNQSRILVVIFTRIFTYIYICCIVCITTLFRILLASVRLPHYLHFHFWFMSIKVWILCANRTSENKSQWDM